MIRALALGALAVCSGCAAHQGGSSAAEHSASPVTATPNARSTAAATGAPESRPAPTGRTVTFESVVGKSGGPVGARLTLPTDHPKDRPVVISVEVWASDGAADSLEVAARPDPSLEWGEGEHSATFAGPIPQGEKRTFRFTVIPHRDGPAPVAIDVARTRGGQRAARTVAVKVNGGGSLDSNGVPVGAGPK